MSTQQHQNRMGQHFREQGSEEQSMIDRCCQMAGDSIRENPMLATVAAFGVGIGLGAMVGAAIAEPMGMTHRRQAEHIGRKVLDSFAGSLPKSVRQQLHI